MREQNEARECGLDVTLDRWVHCFLPGACRCRCGECVVRQPVRRARIGFYGRAEKRNV